VLPAFITCLWHLRCDNDVALARVLLLYDARLRPAAVLPGDLPNISCFLNIPLMVPQLNQDKRATLMRMVPTTAKMLAESDIVAQYKFPDMEYFTCSAAPLKAAVAAKLKKRFPGVALCQSKYHVHL
jgi:hypothetical protein